MPRLTPLPRDAFDFAAARHLLVRAGFGGTPGMVQGLLSKGLDGAVDWLVISKASLPLDPTDHVQADTFDPRTPNAGSRRPITRRTERPDGLPPVTKRRSPLSAANKNSKNAMTVVPCVRSSSGGFPE